MRILNSMLLGGLEKTYLLAALVLILGGCAFAGKQVSNPQQTLLSGKQSVSLLISENPNAIIIRQNATVDDRMTGTWIDALKIMPQMTDDAAMVVLTMLSPATALFSAIGRGIGVAIPIKVDSDEVDSQSLIVIPLEEGSDVSISLESVGSSLGNPAQEEAKIGKVEIDITQPKAIPPG